MKNNTREAGRSVDLLHASDYKGFPDAIVRLILVVRRLVDILV